jgi:hypothetical protein
MKRIRSLWSPNLLPVAILLLGVALRLVWLVFTKSGFAPHVTESQRIGVALATTGHFADAFRIGSGPTAHVSPVIPWLIASVYSVAGVARPGSELILSLVSIALVTVSFGFNYLAFLELGAPKPGRLLALAMAAILPCQFSLEARELRVWEAPFVVAAVSGLLLWALRLDRRGSLDWRQLAPLALIGAIVFLVSPPGGLAAFAIVGLLTLRRARPIQWGAVMAIGLVATVLVSLPWALRNQAVLGRAIWTRSNAGLELGLAYNDTLAQGADRGAAYLARLHEMHPAASDVGYAAMRRAGGEIAYSDQVGATARLWIKSHPGQTAELLFRHVRQYIVPPAWFFHTWGKGGQAIEPRRLMLGVIALLGMAALVLRVFKDHRYLYVAAVLALLVAPYIVVQPILRYRYLTSTIFLFLACEGVSRAALWVRSRYWPSLPPGTPTPRDDLTGPGGA